MSLSFVINSSMIIKDTREYVESEIPQEEQKYQGWFWHKENKTFVRWSDFIETETLEE